MRANSSCRITRSSVWMRSVALRVGGETMLPLRQPRAQYCWNNLRPPSDLTKHDLEIITRSVIARPLRDRAVS